MDQITTARWLDLQFDIPDLKDRAAYYLDCDESGESIVLPITSVTNPQKHVTMCRMLREGGPEKLALETGHVFEIRALVPIDPSVEYSVDYAEIDTVADSFTRLRDAVWHGTAKPPATQPSYRSAAE